MKLDYLAWLEFLFPVSPDEKLVKQFDPGDLPSLYRVEHQKNFIALSSFQEPVIRASVHLTKYHHHQQAMGILAFLLNKYLTSSKLHNTILIPIPLSQKRERERGYNQVLEVIKVATRDTSINYESKALQRIRHTAPQTSLDKVARLKNVSGAFVVTDRSGSLLANKDIILLDDVVTTGATLGAAKAALLPHSPASVTAVALAH